MSESIRYRQVLESEIRSGITRALDEAVRELGGDSGWTYIENGESGPAGADGTAKMVWTVDSPELKQKVVAATIQGLRKAANGLRLTALMIDDAIDALKKDS